MNYEELVFDRAIEGANKIILLGSALKTGLFSALTEKKGYSFIDTGTGS